MASTMGGTGRRPCGGGLSRGDTIGDTLIDSRETCNEEEDEEEGYLPVNGGGACGDNEFAFVALRRGTTGPRGDKAAARESGA